MPTLYLQGPLLWAAFPWKQAYRFNSMIFKWDYSLYPLLSFPNYGSGLRHLSDMRGVLAPGSIRRGRLCLFGLRSKWITWLVFLCAEFCSVCSLRCMGGLFQSLSWVFYLWWFLLQWWKAMLRVGQLHPRWSLLCWIYHSDTMSSYFIVLLSLRNILSSSFFAQIIFFFIEHGSSSR